jgi:hypothetical protein
MDELPHGVVCPAHFEMLSADTPPFAVTCELSYDAADPLAVTARFTLGEQSVAWTFARSLLQAGMFERVGEGDIAIRPGIDSEGYATVYVELCSPHGTAVLRTRTSRVATFLDMTTKIIPLGGELNEVDMDAVIARLLHEASA